MMPRCNFCRDLVDADSADAGRRVGEVRVDEFLVQANRFEDLRSAIAFQRRNSHLRHDFEHALGHGLVVVLDGRDVIDASEQVSPDHVVESFKRQIRIDGGSPVPDQQAEMMHFTRLAGFHESAWLSSACLRAPGGDGRRMWPAGWESER